MIQASMETLAPKWLKNDRDAVAFILAVHKVVELWDDLIDKDKDPQDADINAGLYAAMVTLPRNPFYQRHFALLSPLVESAILDWWTANELETQGGDGLHTSYILRCSGLALTVMCARIIGGVEWASAVNNELRSLGDTWAEYAAKHEVA